ncbi:unnamed protein product [Owenia fusiformis]|uniref:Oxysterol-binding protein n=1 Tax=Owenia fusiformis TaxID=6347 RepID=A0A8J1UC30_OWEFU|nr:unnamed protein product [Owenia fusiformis]
MSKIKKLSGKLVKRSVHVSKADDSYLDEDFESQESEKMRQPLEGQLSKYTNVMKGWQYRFFVLDPMSGLLEYFEKEEHKRQRPRGSVYLAGSVIAPSDEDSQTFTVNAANGEIFRLRAYDAKDRQHWLNRLRYTAEYHTNTIAQNAPPLVHRPDRPDRPPPPSSLKTDQSGNINKPTENQLTTVQRSHHKSTSSLASRGDSHREVKEVIHQVQSHENHLFEKIDDLPAGGEFMNRLDKDLLLLKATSQATVNCLEQCLHILQQQQLAQNSGIPAGATVEWLEPRSSPGPGVRGSKSAIKASPADSFTSALSTVSPEVPVNHDDDIEDDDNEKESELGGVEAHKSVILHLLSQLKLGMDLTRVVLPTFILEKRSLLEMFADCMAHPDLFMKTTDISDPESRMLNVLEWYLTSFHAGIIQGSVAKKPYNPIIGETFHCSWQVPKLEMSNGDTLEEPQMSSRLIYIAEQVSHHPPVSAFYFECPDKKICMNGSIWTKSKFMGMSIGVSMVGKVSIYLQEYDEEYKFSLPSAYARSILTVPWVELGDRINITCQKTGYTAAVTFHTKPFYGGRLHEVSAELKNLKSGAIVCRAKGEWNGNLEFNYLNTDEQKIIDTTKLKVSKKCVRPINLQGEYESRKLWQHVTNSLKMGDVNTATEHKRFLEDRQREGEKYRRESSMQYPTKYFHLEGDLWTYNNLLHRTS